MSLSVETPQDRVRAALLSHFGQVVPEMHLLHAAFGHDLPQRPIMALRDVVRDLRTEDGEPIERTPTGYRMICPAEGCSGRPLSGLIASGAVRECAVQPDLFGEAAP